MLDGWFVMTLPVELRQGRFLFMVKDVLVIQVELWIVRGYEISLQ